MNPDMVGNVEALVRAVHSCGLKCAGIRCDALGGRPPRGLVFDCDSASAAGAVVVGLNPGRAAPDEVAHLQRHAPPHEGWCRYWETSLKQRNPYFVRMRRLLAGLNMTGPVLWTNVVKCETSEGARGVPLQTQRTCATRYLQYELHIAPGDWPLVAVGREAFLALASSSPGRHVLGVPHPTGAYPQFRRLFNPDWSVQDRILAELSAQEGASVGTAVWLPDADARATM